MEQLIQKVLLLACINELCQYCGKYEEEHNGACDNCKWYQYKYED